MPAKVEAYLRKHIPLSAGMDITVLQASPSRVSIEVPLPPNMNRQSTAFGGSVAALAILTGWTLVHLRLKSEGLITHTVIQSSTVHYNFPIKGTLKAVAEGVADKVWQRFTHTLARRGKGRVHVTVNLESEGEVAASFEGAYVAISGKENPETFEAPCSPKPGTAR